MSVLVFDIETVSCGVAGPPRNPSEAGRLAPPAHWRIVAIGFVWLGDGLRVDRMGCISGDERQIVSDFMRGVAKAQPLLVGANTRGFDLPVLLGRAFHHGIQFPFRHRGRDLWYRYSDDAHTDVMEVLSGWGAGQRSSVDAWAKLAGFPGKMGLDGTDVARLVAEEQWDALNAYALSDAVQETAIFLRTEYVRGELTIDAYQAAGRALLSAIAADERVAPMLALVDEERFLLTRGAAASAVDPS